MEAQLGLPACLGSEGVVNPLTVASADDVVDMYSMPTVEMIDTSLVDRRHMGVFLRKTSALEYMLP